MVIYLDFGEFPPMIKWRTLKWYFTMKMIQRTPEQNSYHLLKKYLQPLTIQGLISFMSEIKYLKNLLNIHILRRRYCFVLSMRIFTSPHDIHIY